MYGERPLPVDGAAAGVRPTDEYERQHLLLQENVPPDMTGYVLCSVCVFFLANPIFGAVAFILAGKYRARPLDGVAYGHWHSQTGVDSDQGRGQGGLGRELSPPCGEFNPQTLSHAKFP